MKQLKIEASTPLCQLQDAGRCGVRHLGVTQGGALDWVAMRWANWLLGNPLEAPVVEVALGGFSVVAEQDCVLALAGADLDARVDDQPVVPWRSFALSKGQRLTLKQPKQGVRAYLAAPGGFQGEDVLGSCATVYVKRWVASMVRVLRWLRPRHWRSPVAMQPCARCRKRCARSTQKSQCSTW